MFLTPAIRHLSDIQAQPIYSSVNYTKMADQNIVIASPHDYDIKIIKWRVREGFPVNNSQVILLYEKIDNEDKEIKRLKSVKTGVVKKRLYQDGAVVKKGEPLLELSECIHATVIKDMCADCGADLRQNENGTPSEASVPMVHSVPELKVTQKLAQQLGQEDTKRLLEDHKLVLLVDLDQTVIHTTNDNVPNNIKGIYHFQLYGPHSPWYHTRLRPGTIKFLSNVSKFYELHICTFGARNYAHMIAQFLDPDGKFFSHRILSRDECFNVTSKTDNLKALFPCGDSMVCIIDDREDVWNMAANLIQVKPYHFFQHTGDINAPPELSKHELDGKGVDFKDFSNNITEEEKTNNDKDSSKEDDNKNDDKKDIAKTKTEKQEKNEKEDKNNVKDSIKIKENNEKNEENSQNAKDSNENGTENKDIIDLTDDTVTNSNKKDIEIKPQCKIQMDENGMIEIEDADDYLLYLETILKKIHKTFYEIYDETKEIPDLKILIPKIRSEVLLGTNLVFSGLVPTQMKLEQSRAYLIARSLGANVSQHMSDETTHLVAATAGTFKVNAARKRKDIHIVTPDWLWCCAERWERVSEKLFPLDPHKPSKMRQPPPHCHSPEHVVNYNEKQDNAPMEPEPKFVDTINPLLSFSNADLDEMNEEFEQFFESDTSSDDEEPINIENPPMEKSLRKRKREEAKENRQRQFFTKFQEPQFKVEADDNQEREENGEEEDDDDEVPSAKFRRGEDVSDNLDIERASDDSEGSEEPIDEEDDGDWNMMGAALEREFLGLEE